MRANIESRPVSLIEAHHMAEASMQRAESGRREQREREAKQFAGDESLLLARIDRLSDLLRKAALCLPFVHVVGPTASPVTGPVGHGIYVPPAGHGIYVPWLQKLKHDIEKELDNAP